MPSRILFPLLGLLVVGALVGLLFYANRGAHIEIKGEVQKVRTHSAEEQSSVVILDFRFVNPADYPFVVRKIDVTLVGKDGKTTDGAVIADSDAARYLTYYPVLGQKYNDSLVIREKVLPKQSLDKMVMARFELPEATLKTRQRFRIRVEEVDGAVSELLENPAP